MICVKGLSQFPLTKLKTILPSFVKYSQPKKHFLKLTYIMITTTYITFQTNILVTLYLIIHSFVNVQNQKHGKSTGNCFLCLGCLKGFLIIFLQCSTKPISKIVSKLFKKIFDQISNSHQKSTFYKNYNRSWVIRNVYPLIDKNDILNSDKKDRKIFQLLTQPLRTQTCDIKISFEFYLSLDLKTKGIQITSY